MKWNEMKEGNLWSENKWGLVEVDPGVEYGNGYTSTPSHMFHTN